MRSRVLWGLLLSPLPRTICHVVNCDRWFEKRHSRIKYICHFSSVFGDYIIIPWLLLLLLLLSHFSRVQLFATPWTAAHQVPPSMVFSRQEYWGGVPSPSLFLEAVSVNSSLLKDGLIFLALPFSLFLFSYLTVP